MGWKGTLRSVNAELNRQSRESDKRHRAHQKDVERQNASDVVRSQQQYFRNIQTLHHECRTKLDWARIESEVEPQKPENTRPLYRKASGKLENYVPGLVTKLFRLEQRQRDKLKRDVQNASTLDDENYQNAVLKHEASRSEWAKWQDLAERLNN